MPSQQQVRWSQLKVGILVIVALCVLVLLLFLMTSGTGGFFTPKLIVRSYFQNAAGIKVGAPVMLEGVGIGDVANVRVVSTADRKLTPVEVTMRVNSKYRDQIRMDSKAKVSTVGVLGDAVIDINSQAAVGPPIMNNGELHTNETPTLADVIQASQGTIEQLNTILSKVNLLADDLLDGKGSIGQLITNPDLYNRANDAVIQVQGLVDQIAKGKGSIGKLITDDELYNRLNAITGQLEDITKQINSKDGTIGMMIKDPTLYNNANQAIANANTLINNVNNGKLTDTLTKMNDLVTQIDSGQGTIGQLVKNPSLYNNADQMLNESRQLITGIRENPKKYLTFHVKIF